MLGFLTRRPWAIHNPLKSWTLAGLSLRECQLLVASMTDAEMKVSWAHLEGWTDWKPLSEPECHDLFLHKDEAHPTLPAVPQMLQDDDHEITQVRMITMVQKQKEIVKRKFTRFTAKIPAKIIMGTYNFETHTMDLSEGGFCFEDRLPEWVAGYFTVVLGIPGKSFEFNCFLAEDQKKDKFRSEIAPTTAEKVLEEFGTWLAAQGYPETPQK
jgi:hypothetical protein